MAGMESFGGTIASLEEELACLDESLPQEQLKNNMMKAAILESQSQQEADKAEIYELIKRIADLECQVEDAACLEGMSSQRLEKSASLQVCHAPRMILYSSSSACSADL